VNPRAPPLRWSARFLSPCRETVERASFPLARRQLCHIAEAALLTALMAIFAALPVDWASSLGGRIARRVGPHLAVSRRALDNLARAMPENGANENRRILRGMWDNLGRAMAEQPHLASICAAASDRVEIVDHGAIADLLAGGRQVILFGGHFANWEVAPSILHRMMGGSLLSVYRAANNPWVDRLQRRRLLSRRAVAKGAAGARALLRHLRCGGHVAMLVDQKQNDGIAVPFFGMAAMTAPALARLSRRFDCAILPVRAERLAGARFRVTVLPALETVRSGDPYADVLATMTRVNQMIESWVCARPEQWTWLHRRWPS